MLDGKKRAAVLVLCLLPVIMLQVAPLQAEDTGNVQVTCPPGFRVYLDASHAGVTNSEHGGLVLSGLSPGEHEIKIARQGYQDMVHVVRVRAGETSELVVKPREKKFRVEQTTSETVQVQRQTGTLILKSLPLRAEVILDGTRLHHKTDMKISDLPTGRHTLTFVKDGDTLDQVVELEKEDELTVAADFLSMAVTVTSTLEEEREAAAEAEKAAIRAEEAAGRLEEQQRVLEEERIRREREAERRKEQEREREKRKRVREEELNRLYSSTRVRVNLTAHWETCAYGREEGGVIQVEAPTANGWITVSPLLRRQGKKDGYREDTEWLIFQKGSRDHMVMKNHLLFSYSSEKNSVTLNLSACAEGRDRNNRKRQVTLWEDDARILVPVRLGETTVVDVTLKNEKLHYTVGTGR